MMTNRKPEIGNRKSDDELISAYVDGQLAGDALAAFEARLRAEPALKQRADVTRLLVSTARALPAQPLPRHFTVPVPARPRSQATSLTWFLRLGSALATAVFVIAFGIDLAGLAAPRPATQSAYVLETRPAGEAEAAQAPAEVPAPAQASAPQGTPQAKQERSAAPAETQTETLMATSDISESTALTLTAPYDVAATQTPTVEMQSMAVAAAPAEDAASPMPEPTQPPSGMGGGVEPGAPAAQAETTATPEAMDAARSANTVTEAPPAVTPAAAADTQPLPDATAMQAPPIEPASTPWLRIVAGLAFILAIVLGVLGWRR